MTSILILFLEISIHALREEGDREEKGPEVMVDDFYPHPPRGGRHLAELQNIMMRAISIHALREEGDEAHCGSAKLLQAISIHALREEGDSLVLRPVSLARVFLSTPSARRATRGSLTAFLSLLIFLSTPSARRATSRNRLLSTDLSISIHALREEGDGRGQVYFVNLFLFLSTPSARRATFELLIVICYNNIISIHALREEGDRGSPVQISCLWHFYPRPPRGGRLHLSHDFAHACQFLSTPSARRATDYFNSIYTAVAKISIHALREEGDVLSALIASASKVFLSTPSARRATIKMPRKHLTHDISIHALREEGDQQGCAHALCNHRFLSTPSARRATSAVRVAILSCVFLSTPSARRATVHFLRRYRLWANFYPRPPRGGRRTGLP